MLNRLLILFAAAALLRGALLAGDKIPGESLIEVKLTLPKGDTYIRGTTDPVSDLAAEITLVNTSAKENRDQTSYTLTTVTTLTNDEVATVGKMSDAEKQAILAKKIEKKEMQTFPSNQDSQGVAYTEPQLGPHDSIDFVITRIPEEGETVPDGAKQPLIRRDNKADHISAIDVSRTRYVAAGESSPVFSLPVGKYYVIRDPGMYSIKAIIRLIGDSSKPQRVAESNEEKFRVLPFKVADCKIEYLQENWDLFERGAPHFDYLLYQVKSAPDYDDLYSVQRIPIRGVDRWEWTRLCTVKYGTQAQVAQLAPKKVAVLVLQAKGDGALYTLDFSAPGVNVSQKPVPVKEGATPKLKVEAGVPSVE